MIERRRSSTKLKIAVRQNKPVKPSDEVKDFIRCERRRSSRSSFSSSIADSLNSSAGFMSFLENGTTDACANTVSTMSSLNDSVGSVGPIFNEAIVVKKKYERLQTYQEKNASKWSKCSEIERKMRLQRCLNTVGCVQTHRKSITDDKTPRNSFSTTPVTQHLQRNSLTSRRPSAILRPQKSTLITPRKTFISPSPKSKITDNLTEALNEKPRSSLIASQHESRRMSSNKSLGLNTRPESFYSKPRTSVIGTNPRSSLIAAKTKSSMTLSHFELRREPTFKNLGFKDDLEDEKEDILERLRRVSLDKRTQRETFKKSITKEGSFVIKSGWIEPEDNSKSRRTSETSISNFVKRTLSKKVSDTNKSVPCDNGVFSLWPQQNMSSSLSQAA